MNKMGRAIERMMCMDDAAWQRHANPWSGWTRVATAPLIGLAVWSRVWFGWWSLIPTMVVFAWIWINPRAFPRPKSVDNWMSRGVLGERIWLAGEPGTIADHHRRVRVSSRQGASLRGQLMVRGSFGCVRSYRRLISLQDRAIG
ncbi:hypothetical protein Poly51_62920 [Rubripirellula tenax]|uniref:Uncharacterized protein n=1 Tax=Rubripirellula tenax TaxID=2528015 RepID=A0A5C6E4J2_9BACT|nr:DUF6653 family protein [Rubripirellula tenax]TWU43595.1 hypothetical protein Poly51_62920 [Rubripirellula tenax]